MKKGALVIVVLFKMILSFGQFKPSARDYKLIDEFNLLLNKQFPVFELEDEQGKVFNTASLKGKTVYIDYWFSQCPPCLKEIPHSKSLKTFFAADTNIVFVNISIEYVDRKQAWKEMIASKQIGGINLFYAKNRPQKVNLIQEYKVTNFPTYMLLDTTMTIIGHNAPFPSDKGLVQWSIYQASKNVKLSSAYLEWRKNSKEVREYLSKNIALINALEAKVK